MQQNEETKHFKFMTYLKLCEVERKIGNDQQCQKYIEEAEKVIHDLYKKENHSILVSKF